MRFAGKTVVVTGAGGFIGSHLVERLVARRRARARDAALHVARPARLPRPDRRRRRSTNVAITLGDVRDFDAVREVMRGADAVFHLAALIGIPYSYEHPQEVIDTNIVGTSNVLLAAKELGTLERIVLTSTSEVYGSALRVPMDEEHPLQAQSPYSATKIAGDALGRELPALVRAAGDDRAAVQRLRAAAVGARRHPDDHRAGGHRRDAEARHARHDARLHVRRGHGARRSSQIGGADAAIGEVVNVGSGSEVSIREIVRKVGEIIGRELRVEGDEQRLRPAKSEVSRLLSDSSKAERLAGWRAEVVARRRAAPHGGLDPRAHRAVPPAGVRRMKAVILAGGQGVRLRPLTYTIPKPLLPIGEKPILEEIIERLKRRAFDDLVIAVGYRAELIETYFRDGAQLGVHIDYVRETQPLGTAGPLALVRDACRAAGGRAAAGDERRHPHRSRHAARSSTPTRAAGNEITVATREFQLQHPYGVHPDRGGRITGIVEKPSVTDIVSAGIYAIQPSALDVIPRERVLRHARSRERAARRGPPVGAYRFDGEWLAIDRIEQLEDAARLLAERTPEPDRCGRIARVKLSIVIPVRNERDTVVPLIERVRAVDCGMPKELIVVDGASTDGTREALLALPPSRRPGARARGRGARQGARGAHRLRARDRRHRHGAGRRPGARPGEIPSLLAPIVAGETDVVFGSRFKGRGRGSDALGRLHRQLRADVGGERPLLRRASPTSSPATR